jgi:hypothetical protein
MRRRMLALAVAAAAAGCGPVYEPVYRFEPPPGAQEAGARRCLAACEAARAACLPPARDRLAACEARASLSQDLCRSNARIDFEICRSAFEPTGSVCVPRICQRPRCPPVEAEACESDYRRCFAACGGTVVEERLCVANCPS